MTKIGLTTIINSSNQPVAIIKVLQKVHTKTIATCCMLVERSFGNLHIPDFKVIFGEMAETLKPTYNFFALSKSVTLTL